MRDKIMCSFLTSNCYTFSCVVLLHGRNTITPVKLRLTFSIENSFLIRDFDEVDYMVNRDNVNIPTFSLTHKISKTRMIFNRIICPAFSSSNYVCLFIFPSFRFYVYCPSVHGDHVQRPIVYFPSPPVFKIYNFYCLFTRLCNGSYKG